MEQITVQVDEALLEAAQAQAEAEGVTLSDVVGIWLELYVHGDTSMKRYDEGLAALKDKMRDGLEATRDEMDER